MAVNHLFCVLRPDPKGNWYIQNDVDHAPVGIAGLRMYSPTLMILDFDRTYTKAGTIQITTDDDFSDSIRATAGLGTCSAGLTLRAAPNTKGCDPGIAWCDIWKYVVNNGGGNLWVNITMLD